MTNRRRVMIAGAATAAASVVIALFLSPVSDAPRRAAAAMLVSLGVLPAPAPAPAAAAERLPALPARGWHHGGPLTADSLRGEIVVLAVFSDTHPSAYDVLPQLETWHEAYARFGVRTVGVHAPEFAFATRPEVIERLSKRLGLTFRIVEDPALEVLGALGGTGSEVLLALAGPDGRLRDVRAAADPEEDPAAIERELRELLRAAHPELAFGGEAPGGPDAPRAPGRVRTIRLGSASTAEGPLRNAAQGRAQPFTAQFRFEIEGAPYVPYPVGWWTPRAEGLEASKGGAAQFVAIRYDAPRAGVVASPPGALPSRLWILRDDEWLPADALGADARLDARGASYVDIDAPRLYFIAEGGGEHVLKLSPEDAGLTLHALTFGPESKASGAR